MNETKIKTVTILRLRLHC